MPSERPQDERITYLIANYNRGRYVAECLGSVRRQRNGNWLALIADDASTDESRDRIAPFLDDRMRLIVNPRNVGYIGTLKRLIAEASTDIVAILDADDAIAADATDRLLQAYASNPSAGFVYSQFAVCDAALAARGAIHGSAVRDGGTAILDGVVGAIRSFRRSAYARTAGLDETMLYAEDRDLVYKMEEVTRLVFVEAVLYHYRDLPDSQSHDPDKRVIGARNTRRARLAAVQRRKHRGIMRWAFQLHAWADYIGYAGQKPTALRFVAGRLAAVARAIGRRHQLASNRSDVGLRPGGE